MRTTNIQGYVSLISSYLIRPLTVCFPFRAVRIAVSLSRPARAAVIFLVMSNFTAHFHQVALNLQTKLKGELEHLFSLPKTIEFSFVLSNVVVEIVKLRINAIRFIFFKDEFGTFEIRINA